jgi:hypothetical protein
VRRRELAHRQITAAGEGFKDPAAGGVRQRGENRIQRWILILNH